MEEETISLSRKTEAFATAYKTACKLFEQISIAEYGDGPDNRQSTPLVLCSVICDMLKQKVIQNVGDNMEQSVELTEI